MISYTLNERRKTFTKSLGGMASVAPLWLRHCMCTSKCSTVHTLLCHWCIMKHCAKEEIEEEYEKVEEEGEKEDTEEEEEE